MNMQVNHADKQAAAKVHETIWLLGQPSLEDYLSFVRRQTIGGEDIKRSILVDEWREANDYYYDLSEREAGIADKLTVRPMDKKLQPIIDEITADIRFQRTFDVLPTKFAMVELDKIIVSQHHIDITHTARLQATLGRNASPEQLLRFCQRLDPADVPIKFRRSGKNKYTLSSTSSDFRFNEAKILTPDQVGKNSPLRANSMVLALTAGYSSNFLSVVQSDNRMVLHNGHHRAYALRALGYTHAPCIVQTVTRRDELNLVASSDVVDEPAFYFKAPRPPLLKDFFDSRIRKLFHLPQILRVVELSFEVREYEVAE